MTDSVRSHQVLVLGAHDSGKTSFVVQLLLRVQRIAEGRLQARAAPSSLTAYKAALDRIDEGRAPDHTETSLFAETPLPLVHERIGPVDLVWPEYAGETIQRMTAARQIPQRWYDRVQNSDVWLLFVRPFTTSVPADVISRRILPAPDDGSGAEDTQDETTASALTVQSTLIELLQMLLHLRGASTADPVKRPVLGVLLSCYDEVDDRGESLDPGSVRRTPGEVLAEHLPLLAAFIRSVWAPDAHVVMGVAAFGRPLLHDQPNTDFILSGPERQGYVVLPDATEDRDLTLAVSLPVELLRG
jgi:hypothetical protein